MHCSREILYRYTDDRTGLDYFYDPKTFRTLWQAPEGLISCDSFTHSRVYVNLVQSDPIKVIPDFSKAQVS